MSRRDKVLIGSRRYAKLNVPAVCFTPSGLDKAGTTGVISTFDKRLHGPGVVLDQRSRIASSSLSSRALLSSVVGPGISPIANLIPIASKTE
jgi:hypothetical protein